LPKNEDGVNGLPPQTGRRGRRSAPGSWPTAHGLQSLLTGNGSRPTAPASFQRCIRPKPQAVSRRLSAVIIVSPRIVGWPRRPCLAVRPTRTTLTSEVPVGRCIVCRRYPLSFRGTNNDVRAVRHGYAVGCEPSAVSPPRRALTSLGNMGGVHRRFTHPSVEGGGRPAACAHAA
jgi:hypothetical protein